MALLLFLLASLLIVSSPTNGIQTVPAAAPKPVVKPPTPAPTPIKTPPPIAKTPTPAPVLTPRPLIKTKAECRPQCADRCSLHSRPNVCLRACNTCCDRCLCVPPGTAGNKEVCKCYANMTTKGGRSKCP